MLCFFVRRLIQGYLGDALAAGDGERLRRHCEGCATCAAALREAQATARLVADLPRAALASEELAALLTRVRARGQERLGERLLGTAAAFPMPRRSLAARLGERWDALKHSAAVLGFRVLSRPAALPACAAVPVAAALLLILYQGVPTHYKVAQTAPATQALKSLEERARTPAFDVRTDVPTAPGPSRRAAGRPSSGTDSVAADPDAPPAPAPPASLPAPSAGGLPALDRTRPDLPRRAAGSEPPPTAPPSGPAAAPEEAGALRGARDEAAPPAAYDVAAGAGEARSASPVAREAPPAPDAERGRRARVGVLNQWGGGPAPSEPCTQVLPSGAQNQTPALPESVAEGASARKEQVAPAPAAPGAPRSVVTDDERRAGGMDMAAGPGPARADAAAAPGVAPPATAAPEKPFVVRRSAAAPGSASARTLPHLLRLLEGKPEEARAAAVELGRRKDATAVGALSRLLREHPDDRVREAAAEALASIATPDALSALRAAAEADGPGKEAAAKALGKLK